jgi:hypothetical protein
VPHKGELIEEDIAIVLNVVFGEFGRRLFSCKRLLSGVEPAVGVGRHGNSRLSLWYLIVLDLAGSWGWLYLVLQHLLLGHPLILVELAGLEDELPDNGALQVLGNGYLGLYLFQQFLLVYGFPGSCALHHLVEHHSHCEYIGLAGVIALLQRLRRHVQRRSDVYSIFKPVFGLYWKAKIRNLPFIAYPQNVRRLQVSMNHALFDQILEPCQDLLHYLNSVCLGQFFFLFDILV